MRTSYHIRKGKREDIPRVWELIRELAIFEKAAEQHLTTEEELLNDAFGDRPYFHFFVAELEEKIVGISLYFFNYSTWKGKSLHLEDLIVSQAYRGAGLGKALLERTIEEAKSQNCGRIQWQVLDWNTSAIDFYKSMGARVETEWYNCKIEFRE